MKRNGVGYWNALSLKKKSRKRKLRTLERFAFRAMSGLVRHALDTIAPQTNGYRKQKKARTPEEIAAVLKEFDGYYAVRLIKCDGEPEYSNGGLHDGAK
jgi:hypothetical protein